MVAPTLEGQYREVVKSMGDGVIAWCQILAP